MIKITSLLLAFVSTITLAEDAQLNSFGQRMMDIDYFCMQRNFSNQKCKTSGSAMEQVPGFDWTLGQIAQNVMPTAHFLKELTVYAYVYYADPQNDRYWYEDSVLNSYNELKDKMKDKAERENLSDCQRACLATCVSSQIIDYDHSTDYPAIKSAIEAVQDSKGVCREFSLIGIDLMRKMGLSANLHMSAYEHHAIVQVKSEGKWYAMEPQSDSCDLSPL